MAQPHQELRLEPVGAGGRTVRVPLPGREYFLLEYRTRAGTYYDRNIPGEGLLIWHVERRPAEGGQPPRWLVDLECADGRWQEAGYPLGRQADARAGGDNLDFWAHDQGYARAHAGNLGDATDLFDGVRYRAFTADTNPTSCSEDGSLSVRIADIRFEQGAAVAEVQTAPLMVQVANLQIRDENGDGILGSGERGKLVVGLRNTGGVRATGLGIVVQSSDSLLQVLQSAAQFADLPAGGRAGTGPMQGQLEIQFTDGFVGRHTAQFLLQVWVQDALVGLQEFEVQGVSPRQRVTVAGVLDTLGNGDGLAQAGELVHLVLSLDTEEP